MKNLSVNGHNVFLIVIVCFLTSAFLVWVMKKVAIHIGAFDIPNEKRKIHDKPVPLLGGIGIFLSFLIGYMLFGIPSSIMSSILISSFLILLLGIFDDIKPIPAKYKIIVHTLIAAIVVFYGNLQLESVAIFGIIINFGFFSTFVSMLIIVGIINAINLIDGLDGLCAGISSIYFLTIAIIGFILNKFGGLDIMISVIMLGANLGYLLHNFPPAKIYQGDAGSTFTGLIISIIILIGFKTLTLTSLVIPLLVLAIPILDTLFAIIRRKLQHKSVMIADKDHLHHQFLKMNFSKTKTLLIIYAINILFSITSIFYTTGYKTEMIICYILLLFIVIFLVLKTDIIFKRRK